MSAQVFLFECGESWRELSCRVSECALIAKTWLCSSRQWLIPQAAALHACVCTPPLPPQIPAPQAPSVFISDLVALALFSHSEPLYLYISNGWSCHGVVLLPVTMTVNMGAQCLEAIRFVHVLLYLNMSLNPPNHPLAPHPPTAPPLFVLPLCLLCHAFFCKGVKQVCLSSVYSMCPLCPHAPCVPWTFPAEFASCRRWELLMSLCTYLWNTCDSCHLPL